MSAPLYLPKALFKRLEALGWDMRPYRPVQHIPTQTKAKPERT